MYKEVPMLFFINFFITGCDLADNQKSSIYKKYYRLVYKTIYYYIQNDEITKELTNGTFLTVYEKLHTLEDIEKLKNWMCTIASNKARQYLNKNNRLYFVEDYEGLDFADRDLSLEAEVIEKMERERSVTLIRKGLNNIPPLYKQVLTLRYYDELSYKEIAIALDKKIGTIKTHIYRAKKELYSHILAYMKGDNNG
jgi:RNA polymerase sigma-70 factor (ECF subfamily)